MTDPLFEEVCRAYELRFERFRHLQRYLRDVIDPQLAERLTLLKENADLKSQLEALQKRGRKAEVA